MSTTTNCRACGGTGFCPDCAGVGQVLDRSDRYQRCQTCGGSGICASCDGYGDQPDAHRVYIVWQGMVKRVTRTDPELLIDEALIAGLVLSVGLFVWLVAR